MINNYKPYKTRKPPPEEVGACIFYPTDNQIILRNRF